MQIIILWADITQRLGEPVGRPHDMRRGSKASLRADYGLFQECMVTMVETDLLTRQGTVPSGDHIQGHGHVTVGQRDPSATDRASFQDQGQDWF